MRLNKFNSFKDIEASVVSHECKSALVAQVRDTECIGFCCIACGRGWELDNSSDDAQEFVESIELHKSMAKFMTDAWFKEASKGKTHKHKFLDLMFEDIISHTCSNPNIIYSDEPKQLQFGYCCDRCCNRWVIGIKDLRNSKTTLFPNGWYNEQVIKDLTQACIDKNKTSDTSFSIMGVTILIAAGLSLLNNKTARQLAENNSKQENKAKSL